MIPKSVFKKPLDHITELVFCLVVDDDTDLISDYKVLAERISPYCSVQHVKQSEAPGKVATLDYNCIIVDNDGFRINEYPGLETVENILAFTDPSNIIYTSAIPNAELRRQTKDYGVHFVEKGRWKNLEKIMKELMQPKIYGGN